MEVAIALVKIAAFIEKIQEAKIKEAEGTVPNGDKIRSRGPQKP